MERYIKHLELKPQIDSDEINKTDASIMLGFGNVKRPDDKLRKWLKKYESKTDEATHHIVHHIPKEVHKEKELPIVTTNYYYRYNASLL